MPNGRPIEVALIYRRSRDLASFSIESSFDRMVDAFPNTSRFKLRKFISSHLNSRLLPRLLGMLEVWRHRCAINHITGDVHYFALVLPCNSTVLTIHDCVFIEEMPRSLRRWAQKFIWFDLPVRRCAAITTVSHATKAAVMRLTGCPADKIRVIPTVIDPLYSALPKQFNTSEPRVLHIGLAPNKNFARHVAALAGLKCHLHIVGKLLDEHRSLLERHHINYTNAYNLTREEMHRCYVDCDLLLFASTLEGFGMPIIEAQSVGRVVITSDRSSMPEVAGAGACLVDSTDVASIRRGLERVLNNAAYRDDLVAMGTVNAQRFRPDKAALQYEQVYADVFAALCTAAP